MKDYYLESVCKRLKSKLRTSQPFLCYSNNPYHIKAVRLTSDGFDYNWKMWEKELERHGMWLESGSNYNYLYVQEETTIPNLRRKKVMLCGGLTEKLFKMIEEDTL